MIFHEWLDEPYPTPTLSFRYMAGGLAQTTLDMEKITTGFQVIQRLAEELVRNSETPVEEGKELILKHPIHSCDPDGDCKFFMQGKFNLTNWSDFIRHPADKTEKQAFLRVFGQWEGALFNRASLGRSKDTEAQVQRVLKNIYKVQPEWVLWYLNYDQVLENQLKDRLVVEQCCWFWKDLPCQASAPEVI